MIPANSEHLEAEHARMQREADEGRAKARAALPPEEQEKLAVIEEASGMLDRVGIPFVLFAATKQAETDNDSLYFWCFHKLGYDPDYETQCKKASWSGSYMIAKVLSWLSSWGILILTYAGDKPFRWYRNGQAHPADLPPPPPAP